ncbi:MAG: Peptidase subtilisin kexin sedolisin [Ignavibacteria bacterium]|nr:Peptidase subtilisin kexin sedolisin [Ignavibacteria bacterium]
MSKINIKLVLLACCLAITSSFAQNYQIPLSVMGGGGKVAVSTNYILAGTFCQTATQIQSGSNGVLHAGFWNDATTAAPTGVGDEIELTNHRLICNPNPISNEGRIRYYLSSNAHVSLTIYNSIGIKVGEILDKEQIAGEQSINYTFAHLPNGAYICRLMVNDAVEWIMICIYK